MNSGKKHSLLIIGCGWVGKKLGQKLSNKGSTVYGTTRSESNFSSISEFDIQPIQLELPVQSTADIQLPETDTVLISIAPNRRGGQQKYVDSIEQLSQVLGDSNVQVIMFSSTSAYGKAKNKVSEKDALPDLESDNHLLAAEGALRKYCSDAVILRLAGLYGEDRHPAKYMAGRTDISNGDAPANLVHREDVIQVVQRLIDEDVRGEVYNVCSPIHPSRAEVYTTICKRMGMDVPSFQKGGKDQKKVSPEKLFKQFNLEFSYPDPVDYKPS